MQLLGRWGYRTRIVTMTLDQLPLSCPAEIVAVDWDVLAPDEVKRLRALGIDIGARVELAHRGIFFGRDPVALKIGRSIVAVRRAHALAISVVEVEVAQAEVVGR